jgi:hypothetical protein
MARTIRARTGSSVNGLGGVTYRPGGQPRGKSQRSWQRMVRLAGLLALLALALAMVIKWVPTWLDSDLELGPDKRVEETGRVRTALLAVLAGLITVVGAYYTSRTFALNRQGQITERFTRAVDQLGDEVLDVRLGGIYALERLARESREDYGPIVEILAAYVREHAPIPSRGSSNDPESATGDDKSTSDVQSALTVLVGEDKAEALRSAASLKTDVQAALTVLARRNVDHDIEPTLDLSFTDLSGARLRNGRLEAANLRGGRLVGADLSDARLQGAILVGTDLQGTLNLEDADIRGVRYDAETTKWPEGYDALAKGGIKVGGQRRLVLCCDGTWTPIDVSPFGRTPMTNVAKVAALVASADAVGTQQLLFYPPTHGRGLVGRSAEIIRGYQWIV